MSRPALALVVGPIPNRFLYPPFEISLDVIVDIRARGGGRVVRLDDRRQAGAVDVKPVERIGALGRLIPRKVLEVVDVHTHEPLPQIPSLLNLVVDPLSSSGCASDEHHNTLPSGHLVIDPVLDRRVAALLNLLPGIRREKLLTLDNPHVAYLGDAMHVGLVVKAVEHPSSHPSSLLRRIRGPCGDLVTL